MWEQYNIITIKIDNTTPVKIKIIKTIKDMTIISTI